MSFSRRVDRPRDVHDPLQCVSDRVVRVRAQEVVDVEAVLHKPLNVNCIHAAVECEQFPLGLRERLMTRLFAVRNV